MFKVRVVQCHQANISVKCDGTGQAISRCGKASELGGVAGEVEMDDRLSRKELDLVLQRHLRILQREAVRWTQNPGHGVAKTKL